MLNSQIITKGCFLFSFLHFYAVFGQFQILSVYYLVLQ